MNLARFKAILFLGLALVSFPISLHGQPSSGRCPELLSSLSQLSIADYKEKSRKAYEDFLIEKDPSAFQKKMEHNYSSIYSQEAYPEIRGYTDEGYKSLNAGLVEPFPRPSATLRWRDRIVEELASLPPYKGWVYSGAGLSEQDFSDLRQHFAQNKEFTYFFSTSRSQKEASRFLKNQIKKEKDRVPVLFSIKSKTGKNISQLSVFPSEQEILFPPGTQFRVTSITRLVDEWTHGEKPFWKIGLEEVEQKSDEITPVTDPNHYNFNTQIDLKRFGAHAPWLNPQEFRDWKNAYGVYVRAGNTHEISLETLQEIHKATMSNAFFSGFERRRVRRDYRSDKITKSEAIEKLAEIDQLKTYTGTKSKSLAGKLREKALDSFVFEGDLQDADLRRYIPTEELEGLLANPYFRIEKDSLVKIDEERYQARFHYVPPRLVEQEVQNVIRVAANKLREAKDAESYIRTALILNKDLISIHPFLDGNGRSIRLFIDMILAKRNYPLPLTPFEKEYSSGIDTILRQTATEMKKWQLEKHGLGQMKPTPKEN
jgi:fido (protein-threonine AMPylation protein)